MSIIAWIILGGLAGWIASMIMKTNEQQGILGNIVIGVIGALIGGFIVQLLGGSGVSEFSLYSLLVATFGAVLLLAVMRSIRA
ncbi:MAG TPA: GlsB/YeaQ/YmgE family stress response membrane protein [Candidatus Saccharimonadales bacterium]|nr:GlsB/YeaQ/YmgE family stress response membrane protein [Candidatus Saccharimonadales bacterium]